MKKNDLGYVMQCFNCALVYKCDNCGRYVVVALDSGASNNLVCSCYGNMTHIATVNPIKVLENVLNGEKLPCP